MNLGAIVYGGKCVGDQLKDQKDGGVVSFDKKLNSTLSISPGQTAGRKSTQVRKCELAHTNLRWVAHELARRHIFDVSWQKSHFSAASSFDQLHL